MISDPNRGVVLEFLLTMLKVRGVALELRDEYRRAMVQAVSADPESESLNSN
jgi:hypothetical protein